MGFKTTNWPFLEVLRSSGKPCLAFQEKPNLSDKKKVEPEPADPQENPKRFSRIV